MQKKNQIIKWGVPVVLALTLAIYGSMYYSGKPKVELQEETEPKEPNTEEKTPFKIDTVKQQIRIKRRIERRRIKDSLSNLQDSID